MAEIGGWIWVGNASPFLKELSLACGEELNPDLEYYLLDEISKSNGDVNPPKWFAHEFKNIKTIKARFGHDQGADVLQVRLKADKDMACCMNQLIHIMASYNITNYE